MASQVHASLLLHGDTSQQSFVLGQDVTRGEVTEFEIEHCEGQHDVATVRVRGLPADFLAAQLDRPASFTWRTAGGFSETLHGYAKVMSPDAARLAPGAQATLRLFGPTYALREGTSRSWSQTFYHEVVRDVVAKYQYGCEWDPEMLWRRTVMQGDRSDWQLLADLAQELGYCLTNDNAVIRFIDPFKEYARLPEYSGVLVLTLPPRPGASVNEYSVDFASIKPSSTRHWQLEVAPPGGEVVTFRTEWEEPATVFPVAGAVIGRGGPTKFRAGTFPSWAAARQFSQAEVRRNIWTHWMTASCVMDPRIKVGRLVYIDDPKDQYNGHWFVYEAKHRLSVLSLATTRAITTVRMKRTVHGSERLFVGGSKPPPVRPATVLVNGRWRVEHEWMKAS